MSSLLIVGLATILGVVILTVQLAGRRSRALFDSFGVASWLYFLLFAVIPVSLHVLDLSVFQETPWRWIFRLPFTDDAFVYASAIALMGYPLILAGTRCGGALLATAGQFRRRPIRLVDDRTADADLMIVGVVLLALGVTALGFYTWSIGGVGPLLVEGLLFRGGNSAVVSRVAFLKNVAFTSLGASYCFYSLKGAVRRGVRWSLAVAFLWVSLGASIIVLYHGAGRLALVAYVATFPLAAMLQDGKWRAKLVLALGGLALVVVLFGKQLFFLRYGPEGLASRWELVGKDGSRAFKDILVEFSFPYLTLANTTRVVPVTSPYRLFVDLPLAGVYLVPQRVFGVTHPPMVSMVNTDLVTEGDSGTVPVDLISFGYFSAGLVGVVIVTLAFGVALSLCEVLFDGLKGAVFRVSVILFLAFRVMYGDPALSVQTGFYLIVTFVLLLLPQLIRQTLPLRRQSRHPESRVSLSPPGSVH